MTQDTKQGEPDKPSHEASPGVDQSDDFTQYPAQDIGCSNVGCVSYREPNKRALVFWGESGTPLGIQCQHCQRTWRDPADLYRQKGAWNTPYYGLLVSLAAATLIWVLPKSLLPWQSSSKIGISILCAFAALSVIQQIWQRSQRLQAHHSFGLFGEPQDILSSSEVAKDLIKQLEGKSGSIDGKLKQDLLSFIETFHVYAYPLSKRIKHILGLLQYVPLSELEKAHQNTAFTQDEQKWLHKRMQWLTLVQENREQWGKDVIAVLDVLDSTVSELESLRLGAGDDKREARFNLVELLDEGETLQTRMHTSLQGKDPNA